MATYNQPKASASAELKKVDAMKHMADTNVSVANNHSNEYKPTKTSGIKIRGTGAAIKGVTARGPMA